MHRVVEIAWLPRSPAQWATFTASRRAAGDLWSAMTRLHARLRRLGWQWPTRSRWEKWAKGRFPGLSAQSVQQGVAAFCECLAATSAARKAAVAAGRDVGAVRYPWRSMRYRDVTYTNQDAVLRDGFMRLSHGRGGKPLRIRLPEGVRLPGRLVEVTLAFGVARLVCKLDDPAPTPEAAPLAVVGVDLGVNTLIAATDGEAAVLVSGREAKAIQQGRNKLLASIRSRLDRAVPGSRLHKRLQRRKRQHLGRCARRMRDIVHKATRIVTSAFPQARAVVGEAFNDAARKMGRRQAQQVSQAANGRITRQLGYKLAGGAGTVVESYSSQTCPVCGRRQKCRRVYRCGGCGLVAPRDVVGAVNIRAIGMYGALHEQQPVPAVVRFVRPLRKYPGRPLVGPPGSSGGTPARSSAAVAR